MPKPRKKKDPFTKDKAYNLIETLSPGSHFVVDTPSRRNMVINLASDMRRCRVIDFGIHTSKQDDGTFVVVAIPKAKA